MSGGAHGRMDRSYLAAAAMNFLGHLYLSGSDPLVIVGNFMGDEVKGRDLSGYPAGIQRGLRLHRAIDTATDTHPAQRAGRARLRPHAGRYSGVVMDLFFDHLLATDQGLWKTGSLEDFATRMYRVLNDHRDLMPASTKEMLYWMERGDWLTSYATMEGLARALSGLSRRAVNGAAMQGAEKVLQAHMEEYRSEFRTFLPDLRKTAQDLL